MIFSCLNEENLELIMLMQSTLEYLYESQFKLQMGADREITAYLAMSNQCLKQAITYMHGRNIHPRNHQLSQTACYSTLLQTVKKINNKVEL